MKNLFLLLFAMIMLPTFGQGFIAGIDKDDMGFLANKPCVVELSSGEKITGKFGGAMVINGYLDKISVKNDDGTKVKLKPEDIVRFSVEAGKLAKLSMMAESASSIKEMTNTDFDEIVNREYIIFETAMRSNKAGKSRLMQLLNPGFDSKIKVFADPNAKETAGIGVAGVKLTGGEDKSYLFVINDEKAIKVKKGSYRKNFEELYSACPEMLKVFEGEKVKWNDVAGHVFAYDQSCK